MEWALAILFCVAVVLIIWSSIKERKKAKVEEQRIEHLSFSIMEQIDKLQQQIRNIELDTEITAQEAGILKGSSEHRLLLREILDLHKRGYSIESIAMKKKMTATEVEQLLTPYMKINNEGRKVANDI